MCFSQLWRSEFQTQIIRTDFLWVFWAGIPFLVFCQCLVATTHRSPKSACVSTLLCLCASTLFFTCKMTYDKILLSFTILYYICKGLFPRKNTWTFSGSCILSGVPFNPLICKHGEVGKKQSQILQTFMSQPRTVLLILKDLGSIKSFIVVLASFCGKHLFALLMPSKTVRTHIFGYRS